MAAAVQRERLEAEEAEAAAAGRVRRSPFADLEALNFRSTPKEMAPVAVPGQDAVGRTKPPWLRQRAPTGKQLDRLRGQLRGLKLSTVCEEAQCPNLGECWNGGPGAAGDGDTISTATIMVLGDTCTRGCKFCAVNTAATPAPPDEDEPENTAQAVASWGVGYVVLTSVDRDDLPDGGSEHFARTVRRMKELKPDILVEVLASDFRGDLGAVANLRRAGYQQSLETLRHAKRARPGLYTKTSMMLGLGETDDEVKRAMHDIRAAGVDILTFGQYLQPSTMHLQVQEYVHPDKFAFWQEYGEREVGFRFVPSGPLVRSSYKAGEFFVEHMIRADRATGGP